MDDRLDGVIIARLTMPDSTDTVVLLDPERRPDRVLAWHPFPNVLRVTTDGAVVWQCELLSHETTAKCWLGIGWTEGRLLATTFSYVCELDPVTGKIIHETFTK
jgi:hypothetical protein